MCVKTIVTGPFQENTYLVWKEGEEQAVIIDPGDEAERLKEEITAENLRLGAILATHAHLDHVGAVEELRRWSGAAVCCPESEREALRRLPDSCRLFGLPEKPIPRVDHWLGPDVTNLADVLSSVQRGGLEITVHATPGHSVGGVCYVIENRWFVGDTLFCGSVGRFDLPGGDWPTLQGSLRYLMGLPDDTMIYPGHGPATTIGREKSANPFLLEIRPEDAAHV
jgi:hydroxyacylglutathione hydrolase